jgi:hypothetical protein
MTSSKSNRTDRQTCSIEDPQPDRLAVEQIVAGLKGGQPPRVSFLLWMRNGRRVQENYHTYEIHRLGFKTEV